MEFTTEIVYPVDFLSLDDMCKPSSLNRMDCEDTYLCFIPDILRDPSAGANAKFISYEKNVADLNSIDNISNFDNNAIAVWYIKENGNNLFGNL